MGSLTINRKRAFTFNDDVPNSNSQVHIDDTRTSKKLKFSPSMQNSVSDRPVSPKSAAFRFSQYPVSLSQIKRQVHAPCRPTKLGFLRASSGKVSTIENSAMKSLVSKYKEARRDAVHSLRFWGKGKEVIDVDDYEEKERETDDNVDVMEGSGSEDVEIVENGKEIWRESDGKLTELDQPSCSSVISEDLSNAADLKWGNAGKVLDIVSRNRELCVSSVPLHKRLLDSAEKRNARLRSLTHEIEVKKRLLSIFELYRPAKKPVEDVVREPFVPLTKEEEDEVSRALSNAKRMKVLVTHENSNIEITGKLLQCLRPREWLNDEVINVYLELLKEREKREPQNFLKCHFFNTFFYKKLIGGRSGYDFKSVRRWTTQRKLGYCLIDCDKIFVPIHKEIHWCLAVINKKDKKFQYLDSLGGSDKRVLKVLARYFVDEVKDKSGNDIDVSSWKQEYVEDLPEQENGFDCGMFMIKYSDFYSRDVGLCFDQEHMPYFRRRTIKEILRLKAD